MPAPVLLPLFFIVAIIYASVGFGGGSTYTSLLSIAGIDYQIVPILSLLCNIIVVIGGTLHFLKGGYVHPKRILPFIAASIPLAWIGGRIPLSEAVFIGILAPTLLFSGVQMLLASKREEDEAQSTSVARPAWLEFGIGGGIGLLSGLVGIGGGVFLAPVLHWLRWGRAREIAATCSVFILANASAGFFGQLMKLEAHSVLSDAFVYWPLIPAVFIGGQIGSYLGTNRFKAAMIKRVTAILIIFISVRLSARWFRLLDTASVKAWYC